MIRFVWAVAVVLWVVTALSDDFAVDLPRIPDRSVNVVERGVRADGDAAANQCLLNELIDELSKQGGGRVVVPAGTYPTGAIRLRSNVALVVEKGAKLLFSSDISLYPVVRSSWEGQEALNCSPFIYAYGEHDVAISGEGEIDGGASKTAWWNLNGDRGRAVLMDMNNRGVPLEKRLLPPKNALRPQLVSLHSCERVLIEKATFLRSAFWVLHPFQCRHVTVRGVTVTNDGPNGDGCDPESCENVLIEDCFFNTGDDCIAIKSGRNRDGRLRARPTRNVLVRRCTFRNGHGGVVIGSEASGGVENVRVEDCEMSSPHLGNALRIKTSTCRGGVIDGVSFRNVKVGQCAEAVLKINLLYEPQEKAERGHLPTVRNIALENVTCTKSTFGALIIGLPDSVNVSNVVCRNCSWPGARRGHSVSGGVANLVLPSDGIVEALADAQVFDRGIVYERTYASVVAADTAAEEAWKTLKGATEIAAYQKNLREKMAAAIGGFPKRTPLNVQTTDTVQRKGYRIEKLLFESRSKHFVTAHLFLPEASTFKAPYPGVILPIGHYYSGKCAPSYQRAGVLLAENGFAALVYDPIEQGERKQRLEDKGHWATGKHNRLGARAELLGWSAAQFRVWDGIRALDILAARPDVDATRLGVMGMSGGGTLTSYLMALDDRVKAACPAAYLSNLRSVCTSVGPQDAEQNVFGQLAFGLNHLSYVLMRAPSPVLMNCTTLDQFPLAGSRETAAAAKDFFAKIGHPSDMDIFDVPGPHEWLESELQMSVRWMRRHLKGEASALPADLAAFKKKYAGVKLSALDCALADPTDNLTATPEGRVTPDGAVMKLAGARNVYDILKDELAAVRSAAQPVTPADVRQWAGIRELLPSLSVTKDATTKRGTLTIRQTTFRTADGTPVPTVTFLPAEAKAAPVLLLADATRETLTDRVRELVKEGRPVMVAELRAFGETGTVRETRKRGGFYGCMNADEEIALMNLWLGRPLVGIRAEETIQVSRELSARCGGRRPVLEAYGRAAVPAAHAFFVARKSFDSISVHRPPVSWTEAVEHPEKECLFADGVHGGLRRYDWTDLLKVGSSEDVN